MRALDCHAVDVDTTKLPACVRVDGGIGESGMDEEFLMKTGVALLMSACT